MRFTLIVASLVALVACGDRDATRLHDIRRLAVVPVVGETLELARVGRLPFAHRRAELDVSDWRLRDAAYRAVRDLLQGGGGYVVSRLDASPALFPALHAAAGQGACRARDARRELARLASHCACDALLLIIDDRRQLRTDRPQYFRGFSWVGHEGAGSGIDSSEVVVALRAVLVDARTGKVMAERRNDEPDGYPGVPRGRVVAPSARWARPPCREPRSSTDSSAAAPRRST